MKRRRIAQYENGLSIPMTPLIDIVFLLLIYFMLASNFIEEQQFVVGLPQSLHGSARSKGAFVVGISKDGAFFVNKRTVDEQGIKKLFMSFTEEAKARGIEIRAARDVAVEHVVRLMDIAKACKIKKVKITTEIKARQPQ